MQARIYHCLEFEERQSRDTFRVNQAFLKSANFQQKQEFVDSQKYTTVDTKRVQQLSCIRPSGIIQSTGKTTVDFCEGNRLFNHKNIKFMNLKTTKDILLVFSPIEVNAK